MLVHAQQNPVSDADLAGQFWELINADADLEKRAEFLEAHDSRMDEMLEVLISNKNPSDSLFFKLLDFVGPLDHTSPKAVNSLLKAMIPQVRKDGDSTALATSILIFGTSERILGRFDTALESFYEVLSFPNLDPSGDLYLEVENQIGLNLTATENLEEAIAKYETLIEKALESGDKERELIYYHNIAVCLTEVGELEKAEAFYNKALEIEEARGLDHYFSNTYGNLAFIYSQTGRAEKAIEYQQKGLALEMERGDRLAMIDSHGVLGYSYLALGDIDKLYFHYEKCLALCLELSAMDKLLDTYENGAYAFSQAGEYETAYENAMMYAELRDSLFKLDQSEQMADMREKYETEQKELAITNLTKDNELAESQNLILIITAIAILLIAAFAFVLFVQTRRRKRDVEGKNELITGINQKLSDSQDALMASNQLKDKFFALVAHDLRGPITSFQGIGQMLAFMMKKGNTERVQQLIESVDQSANAVNQLLDNLLKWSLSQTGSLSFNPEPIGLHTIVQDVLEVHQQAAAAKGISLVNEVPLEAHVLADRNMMSTVIRNLVGNALKFTEEGGKITVTGTVTNDEFKIAIVDTGVGIPKDKLAHIFQLADTKSTTGTAGEKGTGLGLMLCEEFVLKNAGTISIESEVQRGTTVFITLPLVAQPEEAALV